VGLYKARKEKYLWVVVFYFEVMRIFGTIGVLEEREKVVHLLKYRERGSVFLEAFESRMNH